MAKVDRYLCLQARNSACFPLALYRSSYGLQTDCRLNPTDRQPISPLQKIIPIFILVVYEGERKASMPTWSHTEVQAWSNTAAKNFVCVCVCYMMKAAKFSISSITNHKCTHFAWAGLSKHTAVVFQSLKKINMASCYCSLLAFHMICFIIRDVLWFFTERHQDALNALPDNRANKGSIPFKNIF